ncbi:acyl-CoA dehydrogenase family protein [Jatrophihabitans endophyticus]|uniref:acyl-CoA dehydrogenase family protein n=1 Tax=Jatrophihabitans endophyticus TaxID=1206085 RepID=UPI001A03CCA7|nr:acyl-CoA dehydrogenase family protein [Jatrophihabitans endophyticus]MBE7187391.1 acyl-CoA dehydrogenase family protein [Jatrophihabitans endophyticus]
MDFRHSERSLALQDEMRRFLDDEIYPSEATFEQQAHENRAAGTPFRTPEVLGDLKAAARKRGLWNLFLPQAGDGEAERGAGLSVLDYAPIAELSGRSAAIAPEAMNCSAPDTGNMELLSMFATPEQVTQWLEPLLEGEIRSCFSMTEPAVASSDASNIALTITRDGDSYVVDGRKWWSTGAMRPECKVAIVMGVSDPDAAKYQRHSMILVPLDTPGVTVERSTTVYGYDDGPHGGHGVIHYDHVRVPATNLLGPQGGGFMMAQARLGPGRIHHCMRSLGMAERALELMVVRATQRSAFGGPIASQGVVKEWIAESRLALDQARLLVMNAAWLIDTVGASKARTEIAAIKVAAPRAASYVVDRAVQTFGAAGVDGGVPVASMWAQLRTLHLADGPDEVHLRSVAREELRRHAPTT